MSRRIGVAGLFVGLGVAAASKAAEPISLVILSVVSAVIGLLADIGPGPTSTPAVRNFTFAVPDSGRIHVGDSRNVLLSFDADLGNICPDPLCSGEGDVTLTVRRDGKRVFHRRWDRILSSQKRFDPGPFFAAWGSDLGTTVIEAEVLACGDDEGSLFSGTPSGQWSFFWVDRYVCAPTVRQPVPLTVLDPFTDHSPDPLPVRVRHGQRSPQRIGLRNASTACGYVPFPLQFHGGGELCAESDLTTGCLGEPNVAKSLASGTEDVPSDNDVTPSDCRNFIKPVYDPTPSAHVDVRELPAFYRYHAALKWRETEMGATKTRYWGKLVEKDLRNFCDGGDARPDERPPSSTPADVPAGEGTIEVEPPRGGRIGPGNIELPPPKIIDRNGNVAQPGELIVPPVVLPYGCREAPDCEACCFAVHLAGERNEQGYRDCLRNECSVAQPQQGAVYRYSLAADAVPGPVRIVLPGTDLFETTEVFAGVTGPIAIRPTPRATRTVQGRVVDDGGEPLSGTVSVRTDYSAIYKEGRSITEAVASFSRAAGGVFRLEGTRLDWAPHETLVITLHEESLLGKAWETTTREVVAEIPTATPGESQAALTLDDIVFHQRIANAQTVTVSGGFYAPDGKPLAGVDFVLSAEPGGNEVARTRIGDDGRVELTVPAGDAVPALVRGDRLLVRGPALPFGKFGERLDFGVRRVPAVFFQLSAAAPVAQSMAIRDDGARRYGGWPLLLFGLVVGLVVFAANRLRRR